MIRDVLIVEDDDDIRDTLHQLLEDVGYNVQKAVDGNVGLKYLHASSKPLIVLLDRLLPQVNGDEILQQVEEAKELQRHRYLLLSAGTISHDLPLQNLLERLSVPLLAKPFDIDDLLMMVEQIATSP
jgi:DNA-binding response OmpR family regulator